MGGVIRIQPDLVAAGKSLFPLPYVLLLRDLAQINAGRTLPTIPRTFVEAAVRLANERRRILDGHGGAPPIPLLVARPLDAPTDRPLVAIPGLVVGGQQERPQHVPPIQGDLTSPSGLASRPIALTLGGALPVQRPPLSHGRGAASQQRRQEPGR